MNRHTPMVRTALIMAVLLAWLMGRIASDRFFWSQWLLWVPTSVAFAAAIAGLAGAILWPAAALRAARRWIIAWAVTALALLLYFGTVEHRFLRGNPAESPSEPRFRIVHWNSSHGPEVDAVRTIEALRGLPADLLILTDASWATWLALQSDPLQTGIQPLSAGPLGIVSRSPILQMRTLVAVDRAQLVLMEIDARERLGRTLTVYLVDMPSDPRIARFALAARLRALLDGLAPPPPRADIVIGDFNITRDSASLSALFPTARHAFDEAGHGYGATYPRAVPLYHIDHVLLGDTLRATRYEILNLRLGRHRAQLVDIAAK